MKLLIDENLPIRLGEDSGCEVTHATQLGQRPSDGDLWDLALEGSYVVVTKDSDFFNRCIFSTQRPRIVWVRVGNMRRRDLEKFFSRQWPALQSALETADLVEVFATRLEAISF